MVLNIINGELVGFFEGGLKHDPAPELPIMTGWISFPYLKKRKAMFTALFWHFRKNGFIM